MIDELRTDVLTELIESLDIPDTAYQEASRRYQDLALWLQDESKAKSARFRPSIGPQGSFRLGTVTKPWKREDYDLDVTYRLENDITTRSYTQEQLKVLVGADLNAYRNERQIHEKLEEKHRCWRLNYQDRLQFHMDTVPCIPHTENVRAAIQQRIIQAGTSPLLAQDMAQFAAAITDNRHYRYRQITDDWYISNPEGYARWFESRMRLGDAWLAARVLQAQVKHIEDLPVFQWKTPLQKAVQIIKRHRDVMYEQDPERKPTSIIITTLAANAYGGEVDLPSALEQIVNNMDVSPDIPRVPNPVNPQEDFTDKWRTPEGRRLRLEENFLIWADQAKKDLSTMLSPHNQGLLLDVVQKRFGIKVSDEIARKMVGRHSPTSAAIHVIRDSPPKPWCR